MSDSAALSVVVFRIGDLVCALPAARVREVLPRLGVTRIPGVAGAIEGLANVRGGLLSVADGHALLGRPARPDDEGAVLVVESAGRRYGLDVSQVIDFVELPPDAIAPREELPGVDPALVEAVAVHPGGSFILIDLDTLLAPFTGGNPEPLGGGR
ncbi:MAG TPA: chemotaxis protein CheW [Gemmatimonadales bacterium]|nr:chemotaxis protein CheW [Gemmatimonadales bacterium]